MKFGHWLKTEANEHCPLWKLFNGERDEEVFEEEIVLESPALLMQDPRENINSLDWEKIQKERINKGNLDKGKSLHSIMDKRKTRDLSCYSRDQVMLGQTRFPFQTC